MRKSGKKGIKAQCYLYCIDAHALVILVTGESSESRKKNGMQLSNMHALHSKLTYQRESMDSQTKTMPENEKINETTTTTTITKITITTQQNQ